MPNSRRSVYRVIYPINERPSLIIGRTTYPVMDCSELGLRYENTTAPYPEVGAVVEGLLRFPRGSELWVVGEIIRVQADCAAVTFHQGLPFGEIIAEQRWLRNRGFTLGEPQ
jgi:hypothetical protein